MNIKTKLIIIIILSLLAFLNSFYLAYDWIFSVDSTTNLYFQLGEEIKKADSFCDINDTFSCTEVMNSKYSKILGIPISIFGMFTFFIISIVSVLGILKKNDYILKLIAILTGFGVIFNFYLFYLEIFVIKAFCPVCIAISISLFSIFFISLYSTLKCTTKQ